MVSFYENYVVVQLDTRDSNNNKNNGNNSSAAASMTASMPSLSSSHIINQHQQQEEGGEQQQQGTLTITLIANQETSVQLMLSIVPTLKQIFHNLE
mgnify:CR=1 FL=1